MVDQNASMYLGSPRMAEKVIGEKVTLEEMGGARMHCSVSGCGDVLAYSEEEAIESARRYLAYFPASFKEKPVRSEFIMPKSGRALEEIIPNNQNAPFDMYECIDSLIDEGAFLKLRSFLSLN